MPSCGRPLATNMIVAAANVLAANDPGTVGVEHVEMIASRLPSPDTMDAYERVLGDAMAGDATLFARQDYVEEAWRIVDPVLKAGTAIHDYEKGTWGPVGVGTNVSPDGGWHNPSVPERECVPVPAPAMSTSAAR